MTAPCRKKKIISVNETVHNYKYTPGKACNINSKCCVLPR